jgi:uncharacterized protein (TIGR02679 family)
LKEGRQLLTQALDVLTTLPVTDIPLAEFAAATLGNAHALDPDTSLGSLVLRAVAMLAGCQKVNDAQGRRDAWTSVGVICDELSAPVLVLNLPAAGESNTCKILALHRNAGEPVFLSIRQLLRSDLEFTRASLGGTVSICENPNVLAAAARRIGRASRPLVCIEGQPRTSTRLLLNRLQAAGAQLRYHGDFDWPGVQIANTIISRHNAVAWQMSAEDYRAAPKGALSLAGQPVAAIWDEALRPAMIETSLAVHEEQVMDKLLADLAGES